VIRTELNGKTRDGGQLISGLVDYYATLDFVSMDFVRRFSLPTRSSKVKTPIRLANGQRVTSSTVCDIIFELGCREFKRTTFILRDLRTADMVLGLPRLDDEKASLEFGTTRVFIPMDGTTMDNGKEERKP
jgi:hypothetical protein